MLSSASTWWRPMIWLRHLEAGENTRMPMTSSTYAIARLMTSMRDTFRREIGLSAAGRHAIAAKFRTMEQRLRRLVCDDPFPMFGQRSVGMCAVSDRWRTLNAEGLLSCSIESIVCSLVHLHVNRSLKTAHRQQELVLYDFMCRTYDSVVSFPNVAQMA
jgi:lantibiotic biosynthesis protein